jgi:hypothetical protein
MDNIPGGLKDFLPRFHTHWQKHLDPYELLYSYILHCFCVIEYWKNITGFLCPTYSWCSGSCSLLCCVFITLCSGKGVYVKLNVSSFYLHIVTSPTSLFLILLYTTRAMHGAVFLILLYTTRAMHGAGDEDYLETIERTSGLICEFVLSEHLLLVEQKLPTLPEHVSSSSVFSGDL